MTMSCTWSTQLCHHPSGACVRGPLPFTCMDRILSCTWSNQAHSDYDSRTPSNNEGTTSLQPCLAGGLTEFRQPLQVQSHLEMPGILVQLGHTQRT